jgi:hypothetical protein
MSTNEGTFEIAAPPKSERWYEFGHAESPLLAIGLRARDEVRKRGQD